MTDTEHNKAGLRPGIKKLVCFAAGVFIMFFMLAGLVVAGMGVGRLSNSRGLENFSHQFESLSHPVDSERLESLTDIGILVGSGNHCDFLVAELREYDGQRSHIMQIYASQSVPGLTLGYDVDVELHFPEDEKPEIWSLRQWSEELSAQNGKTRYIVYIFESHVPLFMNSWDVRCN